MDTTSRTFRYFDSGGDGPTVVFLSGVITGPDLWQDVVDQLTDTYRCVVPELPFGGHQVPMPAGTDLTTTGIAAMLVDFLDELELEDVTLVSNDWGGAQLVVYPGRSERVANLVLVSCEAFGNCPPGFPGRLLCLSAWPPGGLMITAQLLRFKVTRNLPFTFGNMSQRPVPDEQMMRWLDPLRHQRGVRRDLGSFLRKVPKRATQLEWAEQQGKFTGEVLIVWARNDKLMPLDHADRLVDLFANSRLRWVDDAKTLIPIDQPEILTGHLREFLAEVTPPPPKPAAD